MESITSQWNQKQALLKSIILKKECFDEAIRLCLEMHAMVHTSEMSKAGFETYEDILWGGLEDKAFRTMPTAKDVTIAWNIWHLTRIEDITANILIAGGNQIINSTNWLNKLHTKFTDTGNAMTDDEINQLSAEIDRDELLNYRIAVGRRTRDIVGHLTFSDLKRKMKPESLQRILDEKGVLENEGSRWLVDFWGKKTVAGILLMPITRHQIVHINDSLNLKKRLMRQ